MYLTPPSTSDSPVSQYSQFFETSSSSSDTSCPPNRLPSCYDSPLQQTVSTGVSQSDLEPDSYSHHARWLSLPQSQLLSPPPMDHGSTAWVTSDGLVAGTSTASSSSVEPDALHSDFNAFTGYDSCLPAPYQTHDAYMPAGRNPSVHEPSLPSTSQSGRAPTIGARPYGYLQDPSNSRYRVESSVSSYSQGYEPQSYSTPGPSTSAYQTEGAPFTSNLPPGMGSNASPAWPKQEYEVSQFYSTPQSQLADIGHERRLLKTSKVKRPTRKHTSKEEANFQCEVKGCGKFFSRSYNYKSHLETHDEKREYPFPCTVDGCNKKFVRKTDLQRHHQSVHMKERNHKCDFCGRLFARKDTLRRHMEDGCSKRFDIGTLNLQGPGFAGLGIVSPNRTSVLDPRRPG